MEKIDLGMCHLVHFAAFPRPKGGYYPPSGVLFLILLHSTVETRISYLALGRYTQFKPHIAYKSLMLPLETFQTNLPTGAIPYELGTRDDGAYFPIARNCFLRPQFVD